MGASLVCEAWWLKKVGRKILEKIANRTQGSRSNFFDFNFSEFQSSGIFYFEENSIRKEKVPQLVFGLWQIVPCLKKFSVKILLHD